MRAACDLNPNLLIFRTLNTHLSSEPLKLSNTDARHIIIPDEAAEEPAEVEEVVVEVAGWREEKDDDADAKTAPSSITGDPPGVGNKAATGSDGGGEGETTGGHKRLVKYSQQAAVNADSSQPT